MQNVASFVLILFLSPFSGQAIEGSQKLSLKEIAAKISKPEAINEAYKSSQALEKDPKAELKSLLKANGKILKTFTDQAEVSGSFVRGEIEDVKTLTGLMNLLQLSMIQARSAAFQGKWPEVKKQFSLWFLFAADFPFEESSLVGLRSAGVLRSMLLDNLETLQTKFGKEMAKEDSLREWFLRVPAPWPVDRVLISEAKRLLSPPLMPLAERAAKAYQKNPYQTVEQSLKGAKGSEASEAALLKEAWREKDIEILKTEVTRIGKLKLRLGVASFESKFSKKPESVQELISARLIEQAPIDYFSGKPLDLTSL
jgi:hypothetical protein